MNTQSNKQPAGFAQNSGNQNKEIKGIMVFYIDVGMLPPFKAEAYIDRYKDKLKQDGLIDQLRSQGYETLWVPVRPNSTTRIEMVPLSPDCMPMVTHQLDPDFLNETEEDEDQ